MKVVLGSDWRVDCRCAIPLSVSAGVAWGQMRHFPSFVTHDPMHVAVRSLPGSNDRSEYALIHRLGPFRFERIGRLLAWTDGLGYAFSDLSRRGPRVGFPHVFIYRLEPCDERSCTFVLRVRGRWTLTWIPRPVVQAWLACMVWLSARCIRAAFEPLTQGRTANERV